MKMHYCNSGLRTRGAFALLAASCLSLCASCGSVTGTLGVDLNGDGQTDVVMSLDQLLAASDSGAVVDLRPPDRSRRYQLLDGADSDACSFCDLTEVVSDQQH